MTTPTLAPRPDARSAAASRAGAQHPAHAGQAPPAAEVRGGRTLDELIVGVWEDLSTHHAVACPICAEAMAPRYGAGAAPVGGRCGGCGAALS